MTARDRLFDRAAAYSDITGEVYAGERDEVNQLLDDYKREIRAEVAAELYNLPDNGGCGCGCWCAQFADPDEPCPSCRNAGGARLGEACHLCGTERTTAPAMPPVTHRAQRPSLPTYSGVLAYLAPHQP